MGAPRKATRLLRTERTLNHYWFGKHGVQPHSKQQKRLAIGYLRRDLELYEKELTKGEHDDGR
jgi:hypothetical protein